MNPANLRIGIGHDTHRLVPGTHLILGGVKIEHDRKLDGHSDADVLLHAVTDAILGAASLGDIGEMFPNSLSANHNRDSIEMLKIALEKVQQHRFSIINLDCIVFAQRPNLSRHKSAISVSIADALGIEPERVSIKAKTGEGIGAVGTEKCIQAQCVVLLHLADKD